MISYAAAPTCLPGQVFQLDVQNRENKLTSMLRDHAHMATLRATGNQAAATGAEPEQIFRAPDAFGSDRAPYQTMDLVAAPDARTISECSSLATISRRFVNPQFCK